MIIIRKDMVKQGIFICLQFHHDFVFSIVLDIHLHRHYFRSQCYRNMSVQEYSECGHIPPSKALDIAWPHRKVFSDTCHCSLCGLILLFL